MIAATALASLLAAVAACDDDDGGSGLDAVGQPCEVAADCYPQLDTSQLAGEVVCLDRVEGGYCTHHCQTDEDCCAVEGECDSEYDLDYVCAPFEATGEKYCFISCEGQADVDADDYCQTWAHHEFICRSTGGGAENRRVCVPEG